MGGDIIVLKTIYTVLLRSVLDYGCVVFGSAADTVLKVRLHCISQSFRVKLSNRDSQTLYRLKKDDANCNIS